MPVRLQNATTVTVGGRPMTADWYVERSAAYKGYPYEAHLRPKPLLAGAFAKIHVGIATAGITAGKGHALRRQPHPRLQHRRATHRHRR